MAAHSNIKLNCEPVSVVVTSNHDNNGTSELSDNSNNCIQRPDHLLFLDPNQTQNDSLLLCSSPTANGANYIGERRGSKSCLRSQSFTSLIADFRQDINRGSSFSRCLNGTFP